MLYKHSFSILCGHLNLNQKRKKIEFGRLPLEPDRYTGLTGRLTDRNRLNRGLWFGFWIWPVFTGNRSNRTGLPLPVGGGLIPPVGKKNPGSTLVIINHLRSWNIMFWDVEYARSKIISDFSSELMEPKFLIFQVHATVHQYCSSYSIHACSSCIRL